MAAVQEEMNEKHLEEIMLISTHIERISTKETETKHFVIKVSFPC